MSKTRNFPEGLQSRINDVLQKRLEAVRGMTGKNMQQTESVVNLQAELAGAQPSAAGCSPSHEVFTANPRTNKKIIEQDLQRSLAFAKAQGYAIPTGS
ncbi:MAG: hypothetical protein HQM06_16965 [Magnetococcales bacterium]|nr:hypothetical protein [Magnetococcales bacterium]